MYSLCMEDESSVVQCEPHRDSSRDVDEKLLHVKSTLLAMRSKDVLLFMGIIQLFTWQQRT